MNDAAGESVTGSAGRAGKKARRKWMRHRLITIILGLVLAGSCTLVAAATPVRKPESQLAERMGALARDYVTPSSAEAGALTEEHFRNLTPRELEEFDRARETLEGAQLKALASDGRTAKGKLEPSGLAHARAQLKAVADLRANLNRLSLDTYAKSYNQLTGVQVDGLISRLQAAYPVLQEAGPGARSLHALAACYEGNYPLTAWASGPTWRWGTGWSTYYYNRVNGQSDCDLVYAYRGTLNWMRPTTPRDVTLLSWLGGQTAMRHTGYSDIVLGTGKVWVIYGHPSLVTLRMY